MHLWLKHYGHDWIDNYGKSDWEYWSTRIEDNEGNILQAVLNVTTTASGEKILYDIDIKKEEQAINTLATSTSEHSLVDASDNVNSQSDERFSLNAPVERVKDLVAVHNVKISDLPNMLELGGMPMPSIAVTKASMGHDKYGDISFLFHSNTIDPAMSRYNKVYGGDAYTPTFPAVRYKPNSEVIDRLKNLWNDSF